MAVASFGLCRSQTGLTWAAMLALAVSWSGLSGCGNPAPTPAAMARQPASQGTTQEPSRKSSKGKAAPKQSAQRSALLYNEHCAGCHGEQGDGKGLAARFLFPKPRDFRAGRFRLISTTNGIPSREDLDAVLLRGMPGSAMLPWAHLSEADRKLLVERVREFRREGARDVEKQLAEENEEELSPQDLAAAAERAVTPGDIFQAPSRAKSSPKAIAHGKELYVAKGCAACHGEKGQGDGQQKMVDSEGLPTRPRDLTRGIFKGNADFASVYRRLWLGMPGSPMPSSQNLTADEVADMVHFVLSLSDEPTRAAAVLKRNRLNVDRVAKTPTDPGANAWNEVPATHLQMTPLWWRDDADPGLNVQAVHDGKSLAIRLTWQDQTRDERSVRPQDFQDMAAVQWFKGPSEPFLGMGAAQGQVDVWAWQADWQADLASGRAGVETAYPNLAVDSYPFEKPAADGSHDAARQPREFLTGWAAGNARSYPERKVPTGTLQAKGFGTLTMLPRISQVVGGKGEWSDGRWTVVLSRPLSVKPDAGLTLLPGDKASIAVAVWNGSAGDRNGQKLVTIWQDLALEK